MPMRSLSSSVLRWPDARTVIDALHAWAEWVRRERPEARALGYFGSYATGRWGVGSDLDVIAVVDNSAKSFVERAAEWDTSSLPVPADLLVYTHAEWTELPRTCPGFAAVIREQTVWLFSDLSPEADRQ